MGNPVMFVFFDNDEFLHSREVTKIRKKL